MNHFRAKLFAPVLRSLERTLPPPVFRGTLYSVAWTRALIHRLNKGRLPVACPAGLVASHPTQPPSLPRLPVYLNRTYEYLPDRLAEPQWRHHCRFIGLDPVKQAVDAGRPVILAFAHFGPFELLRNWLRAAGIPVAIFVGGEASSRSDLQRRKDHWALFPDVALSFYQDQLADAIQHLQRGRALAIALDVDSGKQMQLPVGEDWICQLATGPFRLARRHDALLVPCSIYNEKPWRLVVECGAPVSPDLLAAGDSPAGADFLSKLWPILQAHPAEWFPQLAGRFSQASALPALPTLATGH